MATATTTNTQPTDVAYGEGSFEQLFGDTTQTRVLRYLTHTEDRVEQREVAEAIDRSQAMLSRTVSSLEQIGAISVTDDGVKMVDGLRDSLYALELEINGSSGR